MLIWVMNSVNPNNFEMSQAPSPLDGKTFQKSKRKSGLGPYFSLLDDDEIIDLLEFCDTQDLMNISQTSSAFYCLSSFEPLVPIWKSYSH